MDKTKDLLIGIFTFILIISITNLLANTLDIIAAYFEISKVVSLIAQSTLYFVILICVQVLLSRKKFQLLKNNLLLVILSILLLFISTYAFTYIHVDYSFMFENVPDINDAKMRLSNLMGWDYSLSGLFKYTLLLLFAYHLLKKRLQ